VVVVLGRSHGCNDVRPVTLIIGVGSIGAAIAAWWYYSYVRAATTLALVPSDTAPSIADSLENATVSVESAIGVSWPYPRGSEYADLFTSAEIDNGIPTNLLRAQAWQESRFREDIINGTTRSKAGAVGIMQIVPKWHPDLGEMGALDPALAVPYAARYLASLHNQFGDWYLALAAYNWGPGNLSTHTRDQWPTETQNYVANITGGAGVNV
jgi:soluble lytic murein transglycosylase-like protein